MTMKFLKDAVYSEKYTDRKTGEERTKYTNVGALFEREDGSMCVKIMGSWINFYDKKPREQQQQSSPSAGNPPIDELEDSIPFDVFQRYILA